MVEQEVKIILMENSKKNTYKGFTESEMVENKFIIPDALIKLCRENLRNKNGLNDPAGR